MELEVPDSANNQLRFKDYMPIFTPPVFFPFSGAIDQHLLQGVLVLRTGRRLCYMGLGYQNPQNSALNVKVNYLPQVLELLFCLFRVPVHQTVGRILDELGLSSLNFEIKMLYGVGGLVHFRSCDVFDVLDFMLVHRGRFC